MARSKNRTGMRSQNKEMTNQIKFREGMLEAGTPQYKPQNLRINSTPTFDWPPKYKDACETPRRPKKMSSWEPINLIRDIITEYKIFASWVEMCMHTCTHTEGPEAVTHPLVAGEQPRTKILVSKFHFPLKGTRATWRNSWFHDRMKTTRKGGNILLCQKEENNFYFNSK